MLASLTFWIILSQRCYNDFYASNHGEWSVKTQQVGYDRDKSIALRVSLGDAELISLPCSCLSQLFMD